jgi:hypothetical protein
VTDPCNTLDQKRILTGAIYVLSKGDLGSSPVETSGKTVNLPFFRMVNDRRSRMVSASADAENNPVY